MKIVFNVAFSLAILYGLITIFYAVIYLPAGVDAVIFQKSQTEKHACLDKILSDVTEIRKIVEGMVDETDNSK